MIAFKIIIKKKLNLTFDLFQISNSTFNVTELKYSDKGQT